MTNSDARQDAFSFKYEHPESDWGMSSGPGSHPHRNILYRSFLENFIFLNKITTIIDLGCGDWQFSRFLNLSGVRYHGYDVVPSVVERNRALYGSATVSFDLVPDDLSALPDCDLLIMKDVLQHIPNEDILQHKHEVFDRFPRSLITNSYEKMGATPNIDAGYGGFRTLDLNAPPFDFGGNYVLEYSSDCYEMIRTMLYTPNR